MGVPHPAKTVVPAFVGGAYARVYCRYAEGGSSWTYRSTGTHEEEPYGPRYFSFVTIDSIVSQAGGQNVLTKIDRYILNTATRLCREIGRKK